MTGQEHPTLYQTGGSQSLQSQVASTWGAKPGNYSLKPHAPGLEPQPCQPWEGEGNLSPLEPAKSMGQRARDRECCTSLWDGVTWPALTPQVTLPTSMPHTHQHAKPGKAAHCRQGQASRAHRSRGSMLLQEVASPTWPTRCVEETGRGPSPTAVSSLLHQSLSAFHGHFMEAEVLALALDLPWDPAQPSVRTSASASPHEPHSQGLLSITVPWKEGGGRH